MKMLFAITALLFMSQAFAEKTKIGWRDCGIGAMVFPSTAWAAVTSNITWDLGLTATSSSTTSPGQCAGKSASIAKFINQNYALLEEQTAIGTGKHLVTMLEMANCSKSAHSKIVNDIRQEFILQLGKENHKSLTETQKAEIYYGNVIDQIETKFNNDCAII